MARRTFLRLGPTILVLPLINSLYFLLNHSSGKVYDLTTWLDRSIPFIKYFALPYLLWYPVLMLTLIWLLWRQPRLYVITLFSCLLGLITSYSIFLIAQTTTPRPSITGSDLFSRIVETIYRVDNPYNSFPSIHVLVSFILILAMNRMKSLTTSPLITSLVQIMAVLIILSTLFIKQHTLADVAGGIVIGWILFILVEVLTTFLWRRSKAASVQEQLAPAGQTE